MNQPLFSIISPTFQCAGKIAATAASVLGQAPGLWEYLAVDGGSTDGTVECLRELGTAVRWVSEPDRGIYDAMNKGIALTNGRFLLFLGAGDRLRPDILRELAIDLSVADEVADARPRLIYGDVWWERDRRIHDGVFTPKKLCHGNICQQAILYERGLFARLGTFNLHYPLCADHAFNIRAFGDAGVYKQRVERIIADYEAVGGSTTAMDRAFRRDWFRLTRESFGLGFAGRHWLLPRLPGWAWLRERFRLALTARSASP